jgi:hypothetical protein
MMATRDEIEHYLIQTGHPHETIDNDSCAMQPTSSSPMLPPW